MVRAWFSGGRRCCSSSRSRAPRRCAAPPTRSARATSASACPTSARPTNGFAARGSSRARRRRKSPRACGRSTFEITTASSTSCWRPGRPRRSTTSPTTCRASTKRSTGTPASRRHADVPLGVVRPGGPRRMLGAGDSSYRVALLPLGEIQLELMEWQRAGSPERHPGRPPRGRLAARRRRERFPRHRSRRADAVRGGSGLSDRVAPTMEAMVLREFGSEFVQERRPIPEPGSGERCGSRVDRRRRWPDARARTHRANGRRDTPRSGPRALGDGRRPRPRSDGLDARRPGHGELLPPVRPVRVVRVGTRDALQRLRRVRRDGDRRRVRRVPRPARAQPRGDSRRGPPRARGRGLAHAVATAYHAVTKRIRLVAGQTVAVIGAGGGLGVHVLQMVRAFGGGAVAVERDGDKAAEGAARPGGDGLARERRGLGWRSPASTPWLLRHRRLERDARRGHPGARPGGNVRCARLRPGRAARGRPAPADRRGGRGHRGRAMPRARRSPGRSSSSARAGSSWWSAPRSRLHG